MNKIRKIDSISKSIKIDLKQQRKEDSNKQESKEFEKILRKELDLIKKK